MIIKNNKTKGQYFRYKVNGKILKYFIPANSSADIIDLTDVNQVVSNTFNRRLRHIEQKFDKNLDTNFEVPGDPGYVY